MIAQLLTYLHREVAVVGSVLAETGGLFRSRGKLRSTVFAEMPPKLFCGLVFSLYTESLDSHMLGVDWFIVFVLSPACFYC